MYAAQITFWGQEKGGRLSPPQPGFRPQLEIGEVRTSCIVSTDDYSVTMFEFDEKYEVKLGLLHQDHYGNVLAVGDSVRLFEGNKQIAEGTITQVI